MSATYDASTTFTSSGPSSPQQYPQTRNPSPNAVRDESHHKRPWWRSTFAWIACVMVVLCIVIAYFIYRFAQRLKTFRSHIRLDQDYVFSEAMKVYLSPKTPIHFVNTRIQRYRRDVHRHHQLKVHALEKSIQSALAAIASNSQSSSSTDSDDALTAIRRKQQQLEQAEHVQRLREQLEKLEKSHVESLHAYDTQYSLDENWWRRLYAQREFEWINPEDPALRFNLLDLKPGDCIFTYMQHGDQLTHLFPNHSLIHPFHGGILNATVSWTARLPIPDYGLPNHIGVILKTGRTLDDIILYDSGGTNLTFGSFPHLGVPFASRANNLIPLRTYLGYCLFKKPFCRMFFARLNVNMPWPGEATEALPVDNDSNTPATYLSRQLWREHLRAVRAQLHTHIATMLADGARLMMNAGAVYSSTMSWGTLTRDASTEDWNDDDGNGNNITATTKGTRVVGTTTLCPRTGVLMSKETRAQVLLASSRQPPPDASGAANLNLPVVPTATATSRRRRRRLAVAFTALLNTHEYTFPEFLKRAVMAHLQRGYTIQTPTPIVGRISGENEATAQRLLLPAFDLPSLIMRHAQRAHAAAFISPSSGKLRAASLARYTALEAQLNDMVQRPDYWRARSEWRHFYTTDADVQTVASLLRRAQWRRKQGVGSSVSNQKSESNGDEVNDDDDAHAALALTASWKGVFNGHFLCSSGVYALLEYAGLVLPMCAHPLLTGHASMAPLDEATSSTSPVTNITPTFAPTFYQSAAASNTKITHEGSNGHETMTTTRRASPWMDEGEEASGALERRIVPPALVQPHEFLRHDFQWMPGVGFGQIIPIYDY